jgi:hypothetical protein
MVERSKSGSGETPGDVVKIEEGEKLDSKGVRTLMVAGLDEVLKPLGFKRNASTWSRKVGTLWDLVYLQRSSFSHAYYVEFGVCDEKNIPEGKKPDVVYCRHQDRKRIDELVTDETREQINNLLNFDLEDSGRTWSQEEVVAKVDEIKNIVRENASTWFEKRNLIVVLREEG